MLETAHHLIRQVGQKIGLTEPEIASLIAIDKEHTFEITLAGGSKHQAFRVQHNKWYNIQGRLMVTNNYCRV